MTKALVFLLIVCMMSLWTHGAVACRNLGQSCSTGRFSKCCATDGDGNDMYCSNGACVNTPPLADVLSGKTCSGGQLLTGFDSNLDPMCATAGATGESGVKGEEGESGSLGPAADQGSKGAKGDTGDAGAKGAKGPVGEAAEAGGPGPKGGKGGKGSKGGKGDVGPKGGPGDTGSKGGKGGKGGKGSQSGPGDKGSKGLKGDVGEANSDGGQKGAPATNHGDPGSKGSKGDQGDKGITGDAAEGGEGGSKGNKGNKGSKGEPGPTAANGSGGEGGAQGPKASKGSKGDAGVKGDKGDSGDKGISGCGGATADGGEKGVKASKGVKGQKGEDRSKGAKGSKGGKGMPGSKGGKGGKGSKGSKGTAAEDGQGGDKGGKGSTGSEPGRPFFWHLKNPQVQVLKSDYNFEELLTEATVVHLGGFATTQVDLRCRALVKTQSSGPVTVSVHRVEYAGMTTTGSALPGATVTVTVPTGDPAVVEDILLSSLDTRPAVLVFTVSADFQAPTYVYSLKCSQEFTLTLGISSGKKKRITTCDSRERGCEQPLDPAAVYETDPPGISCEGNCAGSFESGTVVTLSDHAWSGDEGCQEGVVVMDADKTCYLE